MNQEDKKRLSAEKAYEIIKTDLNKDTILGIGTGSTTNYFIEILNKEKINIKGAICSSEVSKEKLKDSSIDLLELNEVHQIDTILMEQMNLIIEKNLSREEEVPLLEKKY